jgi:hypothetical protein
MILYYILIILIGLLNWIALPISALPDVSLPANLAAAITASSTMLSVFYQIVPFMLTALAGILGALIVFELAIWSYKLVKWVYSKIPGIN